ncbi:hypothetical protein QA612_09830 [Evansella sp. AB-P1]|uniref:hypothetical protein n=1 Tax=Evansella sp. AB-P1 TaxID=3037653 RepID=UPI00241C4F47|nr:hypothetical protein [Evansella sp. AB-P1]MDG5787798.1 hypothetical protein [Evansella sp. AB-P1]
MTEHAEIAAFLQVKFLYGESFINDWLQNNGDVEIVEIKVISNVEDGVLIVYRKVD